MEKFTTKRMSLFSGRTHPALADEVAKNLGIELGDPNLVQFANGEIRTAVHREHPRQRRVHHADALRLRRAAASTTRSWNS